MHRDLSAPLDLFWSLAEEPCKDGSQVFLKRMLTCVRGGLEEEWAIVRRKVVLTFLSVAGQ